MQLPNSYDITVPDGKKIGEIQKAFGESLLRSTYLIHAPNGTVTAREMVTAARAYHSVECYRTFHWDSGGDAWKPTDHWWHLEAIR